MSKLYIVPTPIGNLKDITFRAIDVLNTVDVILAEDTRTSGKLLKHFNITTPMQSHHMHNEHKTVPHVIQKLKAGSTIALISDAGTPAISDPGFLLTRAYLVPRLLCLRLLILGFPMINLCLKVSSPLKKDDKHVCSF